MGDMRQKFQDFGWYALEVDGHDVDAIYDAIALAKHQQEKPTSWSQYQEGTYAQFRHY